MSRILEALKRIDSLASTQGQTTAVADAPASTSTHAPDPASSEASEQDDLRGPESMEADVEALEAVIRMDAESVSPVVDRQPPDAPSTDANEPEDATDAEDATDPDGTIDAADAPAAPAAPAAIDDAEPAEPACDPAYVQLAETLLQEWDGTRLARVMVTTPVDEALSGEVIPPLARALAARADGPVLLIDANFRRPILADRLGVEPTLGLADVLQGGHTCREAVRRTIVPGVDLLPAKRFGRPAGDAPRRLNLDALLDEFGDRYALTLLHAAPLGRGESAPLARSVDGVCLLLRQGETLQRHAREAAALLESVGGRLLGCVLVEG